MASTRKPALRAVRTSTRSASSAAAKAAAAEAIATEEADATVAMLAPAAVPQAEAVLQAWQVWMGPWMEFWQQAFSVATQAQTDAWRMVSEQTAALMPLTHKMFMGWAVTDPLTDKSLWWSMENYPLTLWNQPAPKKAA